ncbi:MAG: hypothetical protein C4541_08665 [Candidatus Auribacter fodinae]|jgi:hypothetical protein|uniref:Uncharacterized protein n=1 Tax=Candidatus Auribacter fodinae TaxID=2093366 RepID=A0A3A4QVW7_9BACT|nr:MAG: hypothetical protein C4541_08665 [Candidatus Auribacter fodinae]
MDTNFKNFRFFVPPLVGLSSFIIYLILDPRFDFFKFFNDLGNEITAILGSIIFIISLGYIIGGMTIFLGRIMFPYVGGLILCWVGCPILYWVVPRIPFYIDCLLIFFGYIILLLVFNKTIPSWWFETPITRNDFDILEKEIIKPDTPPREKEFVGTEIFIHVTLPNFSKELYDYIIRRWHAFVISLNCVTSIILFVLAAVSSSTWLKWIPFIFEKYCIPNVAISIVYLRWYCITNIVLATLFLWNACRSRKDVEKIIGFTITNRTSINSMKNIFEK